jgi:hypothetical protein
MNVFENFIIYFFIRALLKELNRLFESRIEIKRINNGEYQTLETLINEEALLFSKYLREEFLAWAPRITMAK